MFVKGIKLRNYRNYDSLNIEFSENFNVIYGDNGQGKTNILEAVFLCASGRSHRTSKDSELIKIGASGYYVGLNLCKINSDAAIEVIYEKDSKKKVRINEIPAKKLGELIGNLNAVMFSPEDLMIVKEGPSERRRFMDMTISQIKPSYFYDLQQYSKILLQRNTLLKEMQSRRHLADTLEIWNDRLVSVGTRIIKVRSEFIKRLNGIAEKKHGEISGGREKLRLEYLPSFKIKQLDDIGNIKENFMRELKRSFEKEMVRQTTLSGPHRDDCDIYIDDIYLRLYGSQGQQRTAVLSLKLSEIEIMKDETGENPVLLLDDVMSELDVKRQQILFERLDGVQTFITCTEKSFFEDKTGMKTNFYLVREGNVVNEYKFAQKNQLG